MRCFARQGFAATSMADIISESGLSAGSIYSHFESKSDLFRMASSAKLEAQSQNLLRELDAATERITPSMLLERLFAAVVQERDQAALMLQIWAEVPRDEELSKVARGNLARFRNLMETVLLPWATENATRQELDPSLAARGAAEAVVAIIQGCVVRLAIDPGVDPDSLRAGLLAVFEQPSTHHHGVVRTAHTGQHDPEPQRAAPTTSAPAPTGTAWASPPNVETSPLRKGHVADTSQVQSRLP
jgi:AcrR family transcriptional regulator